MEKLQVKNLTKIFGNHPKRALEMLEAKATKDEILAKTGMTVGVNRATFSIEEGEIFVVMGLSGSGKSTLVRLLNRLIEPTSGEILLDGENLVEMDRERLLHTRRNTISMVFQKFGLFPHRTVAENVEYGLEVQNYPKKERREKALRALELVGLHGYGDQFPDQLSGGMQQRVGLARALANDAEILLMDEAFSALDPLIRKDMQNELLELQGAMNKTIVFITHDLDEALRIGDRIALMKDGNIVQIGTPEEILMNPADEYVERFVADVDLSRVLTAAHVMIKAETMVMTKGPRVALQLMKESGISNIFIVDKRQVLQGVVTANDASLAIEQGKDLEDVMIRDVPCVTPDTMLTDLFEMVASGSIPVSVIDEDRRLRGVIIRGAVMGALARPLKNTLENGVSTDA